MCENSATKMVPFEYSVKNFENQNMVPFEQSAKNLNLKWYHSRRVLKIRDNNGTISGEYQKSATIMVPFQRIIKSFLPRQK